MVELSTCTSLFKVLKYCIFCAGLSSITYVSYASHAHTQSHSHHATHTKHAHVSHAHHAHTHHEFLYGKVYTCTYSDRKDHLTKFCYDRINASNDLFGFKKLTLQDTRKFGYQNQQIYCLM